MSDDDMGVDYPDFVQIKGSPSSSPKSIPSRENSVILEAREVAQQHKIAIADIGGTPVYVMPLQHQEMDHSPYNSPPHQTMSMMKIPLQTSQMGCHIQIYEEPEEKFRFRYKSEMQGTHGCIHGKNYSKKSKKFPEVQICNVPQDVNTVRLRVALYTNEKPRRHHVHKIMWKQFSELEQDFIEVDIHRSKSFKHVWQGLGIIHTSRRFIDETIFNRIKKVFLEQKGAKNGDQFPRLTDAEELTLKADAARMGKEITDKLNTVVLGFEAFRVENGIYYPLCSMAFTNAINNLKNPSTGELKICRISAFSGSVTGGDEIFIFIERVKKGDIEVKFFQLDENEERSWESKAQFTEGDVHHQYAIAFKTPAYENQTVTEDVNVFFELYRPSDQAFSEPKNFRYKPREEIRLGKRARTASSFAVRSQPLPESPVVHKNENGLPAENSINLGNIIHDLLKNEDYIESLNEPTPYDTVIHSTAEVVPDLLQFSKPILDLAVPVITVGHPQIATIASDSASPSSTSRSHVQNPSQPPRLGPNELSNEVLRTMTVAMSNLTTQCKSEESKNKIRQSMVEIENMDGNNIVHIAVINKEISALKLITEMLEKLNVEDILDYQNKRSSTALHLAVESEQLDATRMLLQGKASPDVYDKDGDAPVHISVRNQNSEILLLLFAFNANPNIPNNFGKFPIHIAVENNSVDAVRIMMENGVDVDAQDQGSGKTPLHLAVERNLEEMVGLLVREAQVDISRPDFTGVSALELAENCKSAAIKKLLSKEIRKQV